MFNSRAFLATVAAISFAASASAVSADPMVVGAPGLEARNMGHDVLNVIGPASPVSTVRPTPLGGIHQGAGPIMSRSSSQLLPGCAPTRC